MSIICQTFVQNAWRSDLCSNCFKSLEDHSELAGIRSDKMSSQRYVPQASSLYQSRGISTSLKWRLSEPLYDRVAKRDFASQTPPKTQQSEKQKEKEDGKGILVKSSDRKLKSRSCVDFASEEALVIGYGGNDYDSDLSPWEMGSDDGSIDFDQLDDNDDDRKITKLTKNNTEFNSSNQNLLKPDVPETPSKKEEKKTSIKNNINNSITPSSQADKTVNITYNNIQVQQKQGQYYFPSPTDQLKSYLHKSSNNADTTPLKNNKEKSKFLDPNKVNSNGEITKENCKNLLNENFTPLNTRTYSFVSELNKHTVISEHSSDSDYSTCRLTAGDSTDSESFQDVDESRMEPCPSFLHGNYPKGLSHSAFRAMECDKKYDGGSSTSGDISNLSDDSDTHDSSERAIFKLKTSRNSKNSQETENKKFFKEAVMMSSKEQMLPIHAINQNFELRSKESIIENNQNTCNIPNNNVYITRTKEIISPKHSVEDKKESTVVSESKIVRKSDDVVSIKVDSPNSSSTEKTVKKDDPNMAKASGKLKENTILPISGDSVPPKKGSTSKENNKKVQIKTPPTTPPESKTDTNESRKPLRRSPPCNQTTKQQPLKIDNKCTEIDDQQNKSAVERHQRDFTDGSDCEASPDTIAHRQSKLAALALELELARRDSARPNSVNIPLMAQTTEVQRTSIIPEYEISKQSDHYPVLRQNSAPSSVSKLSQLPDILQETPTKSKKNRFSLKKLLKRSKESSSLSITPTNKETNPKAWKKQSFDRSRLSLEIVHPMDLATSGESSPTEESHYTISSHPGKSLFKSGYNRARSLSALPQIATESNERSNCSLIECRKVETLPYRKAGTVAERKKSRPNLVRTPSCSALPNRTQPTIPSSESTDRSPPPKPPPPPKYKVMHPPPPPPPPHQLRCSKPATNSPARPPPPKILDSRQVYRNIPENREPSHIDKEYANLGDIRSQLIPKKPERPSAVSVTRESETESKKDCEDLYETLQVAEEEEDHYTYLDDTEVKNSKEISALNIETVSRFKTSKSPSCGRPWLDLQTSYSAIAATNYESLAEIITSSLNESPSYLKKDSKSLKLKDFITENQPSQVLLKNRLIYNISYRNNEQDKIMLLVIPRKSGAPPSRNQTRYPVLASFTDYIPKQATPNSEFASIYILPRSNISTLLTFTEMTSREDGNQHIHLRNYCFILLQLIHTLKSLQAEGIEEVNYSLDHLMMITTHDDKPPIFVLFPEDKIYLTVCDSVQYKKTLCQATLLTMFHFLNIKQIEGLKTCLVNGEVLAEPVADTFNAIAKVLLEEKASSLSQAKGFLEYMLWGPVDVKVTDCATDDDIEIVLQRWLDLQRAQMVKSTITQLQLKVHSPTSLHVFEEYQLIYLLQASVKSLKSVISKL